MLLTLNLLSQISNSALDLLQLSIFNLCLFFDCLFLALSFFLDIFVVFSLSLQRFELSLTGLSLLKFTLGRKFFLFSLDLELSRLDRQQLVVEIFDLSVDQGDLLFSVIH